MRIQGMLAAAAIAVAAAALSGCYSDAEVADAHKVITALPQEVAGCVFVGDVDTYGARAIISQARFDLKMQAAKLGATHLVETFVWPGVITRSLLGVGLSGRAYRCPAGKGPLVDNAEGHLAYEIPAYETMFPNEGLPF